MKKITGEKGITLVALVVTIIVLMILAGITLTLVLGQNGIIGKAKQAKEASANADKATTDGLNNLDQEAEDAVKGIKSKVGEYKDNQSIVSATSNTAIKDDEGNTVTIPAEFKLAADSATKQEDGIVIEDKDGNQFVWIPVSSISNYARTDFVLGDDNVGVDAAAGMYSSYGEEMPSDEQTSVSTYHGYYIGRCEAGDSVSTTNKSLRTSGSSITNKISIAIGQVPYNYVTRDQAKTLATGMKTVESYNATTKLCSSYAWDTAINFIQNKFSNYGESTNQGNYTDTTFTYKDVTGTTQTKASNATVLMPTGETTSVCNIYDMGGNLWEWTTESCGFELGSPYVSRGGNYHDGIYPASYRIFSEKNGAPDSGTGFRVTLFM